MAHHQGVEALVGLREGPNQLSREQQALALRCSGRSLLPVPAAPGNVEL